VQVNDVSARLLQLQREQPIKEGVGANTQYVVFDATKRVLRPETVQVISDMAGYENTPDPEAGFRAGFEALVPGGRIFSTNHVFDTTVFDGAPASFMEKWSYVLRGS